MAEKKTTKKISQSSKEVTFVASKDAQGLKKGKEYQVSENVSDILEAQGLGKKK